MTPHPQSAPFNRLLMVNYYKILKVSPKASISEIKSAYRRLARKMHPDLNNGSPKASTDFAIVAKAYEILSNPDERAYFDQQLARETESIHSTGSVLDSDNSHAQRLRQMAIERRYNKIVDQMIDAERKESLALQRIIFPTVALFVSTFFAALFRPNFWSDSPIFGKIVLLTLFTVGVLRLIGTFRTGFERYTYVKESLHDSILDERESTSKPFSRFAAVSFLVLGLFVCLTLGTLIGNYWAAVVSGSTPTMFSPSIKPEIMFYPPIIVLLVEIMHAVVLKFDR